MLSVAILVPIRNDNGHRDRLWEFCRRRWETMVPDWPIIEGRHEFGPFNRSAAVNSAAAQSPDADVYLIIDNDVLCDNHGVRTAVDVAHRTGGMVVAHDHRIMLNKAGTEKVLKGFEGSWETPDMVETVYTSSVSCAVAVSRKLWDTIGGMDQRFVGWGYEDSAFQYAAETVSGLNVTKAAAKTFHLWHPSAPETDAKSPLRRANLQRLQRYETARYHPELMAHILTEAREAVAQATMPLPDAPIPPIFHRTTPATVSAEVEQWHNELAQMHPQWEIRSYVEPINPADWPLTGDLFDRCANGAQKAGLIRLEALYTHGGVYVDSDVKPVNPFDPLRWLQAFAGWEDERIVPDAVLGSVKGHPAFKQMIDMARAVIEAGGDAHESGPSVTTAVLPHRRDVVCFPPGAFYPHHYLQMDSADTLNGPWTVCAHQWGQSWLTPQQKANLQRQQRTSRTRR